MDDPGSGDDERNLQLLSRAELEERVRRRTAALQNVMDTMVDVLVRLDPEGRIRLANRALYENFGYDEGEVEGKPIDYVLASPDHDDRLSDMLTSGELLERLVSTGQVTDVETYFATAGGEAVPTSLSASVMEEDGEVTGIVCVAKDISERKTAEERADFLHSLLRHDVSNKLQVIRGNLQIVAEKNLSDRSEERVESALRGIDDARDLIENVRTLDRLDGEVVPEPVSLDRHVTTAIERHEDLRRREGVEVENRAGEVTVLGGPILGELFANLVENSLVHSGGSRVRIDASERDEVVVVAVEDDGEGIDEDDRDWILERGHSGRESTGSGLGTFLAGEIAGTYGGDLAVRDSDLGGARFEVTLRKPGTGDG